MLEKLREWLIKLLQIPNNNEELLARIAGLEKQLQESIDENNAMLSYIEDLQERIEALEQEIIDKDKYGSLDKYKDWLDENVHPRPTYYDFGSGRKQVHTIFADSLKDEDYVRAFVTDVLEFNGADYETADDLVYYFNRELSKEYPTRKYYASDQELYGQLEYWATAKETILKLLENGDAFDCDDSMTLRYTCLYYLLQDYFPDEIWRLRGFIVDIWTGGGHALLAWVKEGVNNWVPIETTFYDDRQNVIWNNDYTIGTQMLYQIRYSFDDKYEYLRI
jgi:regulator of replication initiation timing